jgi:hypothetical protein
MQKKNNYYVDNNEFYNELKKYIERTETDKNARMSERLGTMIYLTVEGFSNKYSFRDYTYKEDMIGLAVYYCCKYLKNYDLSRKNVHAYVSKIAQHAFMTTINKEKRQLYTKYKVQMLNDSIVNSEDGGSHNIQKNGVGELTRIDEFISTYENSNKFKK